MSNSGTGTDHSLFVHREGMYNGSVLAFTGGSGEGQTMIVTSYVGATRIATFSDSAASEHAFAAAGGTTYVLRSSRVQTDASAGALAISSGDKIFANGELVGTGHSRPAARTFQEPFKEHHRWRKAFSRRPQQRTCSQS